MLTLVLTADQAAQVQPHLKLGRVMLGRIIPELYTGTNPETSGRLTLEIGMR